MITPSMNTFQFKTAMNWYEKLKVILDLLLYFVNVNGS